MELKITPHTRNNYPLRGILIKGATVASWLKDIQNLALNLTDLQVFAIPGLAANSIRGCLVIFKDPAQKISSGRHELCQAVSANLYIAELSEIFPVLSSSELEKLFSSGRHIFHPDFGLVALQEEVDFTALILGPSRTSLSVIRPQPAVFIPSQVRSFQIQPLAPEEVLNNLTDKIFPKHEKLNNKPLSVLEKMKLGFYKAIFKREKTAADEATGKTELGSRLSALFGSGKHWDSIQKDFEELEKRNKKQFDKLMDLLKNDPAEALKYAIPLDAEQTSRGGVKSNAKLDLTRRWFDFSLFGMNAQNVSGSGSIDLGDNFHQLQSQYISTAQELINRKEYEKAAFVYMKLLKQYDKAADTMELGKHYQEAATIHLKHTGNKLKAAQCYERGNMTTHAITMYKELNEDEKVGDLYMTLDNRVAAMEHYGKVITAFKKNSQYVKASLLYRNKMDDRFSAQSLLLEGWRTNMDAVNCLTNYFSNIGDDDKLHQSINEIYKTDVDVRNGGSFLKVMHHEYQRKSNLKEPLREIAFEIISSQIATNPDIVHELKNFNPGNKQLLKDTLRFKLRKNQR